MSMTTPAETLLFKNFICIKLRVVLAHSLCLLENIKFVKLALDSLIHKDYMFL